MKTGVEVIIVGASISGASLALRLGKCGISSVLVDKIQFPRRKACGDGLSILGVEELSALGVDVRNSSLPHIPFLGFNFFEKDRSSALAIFEEATEGIHGIGTERYYLDDLILKSAIATQNTEAILGETFEIQKIGPEGYQISTSRGEFTAPYIVFATGSASTLPEQFGFTVKDNRRRRYGTKVNISSERANEINREHVSIYLGNKFQACCTPVSNKTVSISIMAGEQGVTLLQKGGLSSTIDEILNETKIHGSVEGSPIGCANIGRYERDARVGHAFTVGDATKQLEPLGGMGMTHALVSSRILADTIRKSVHRRDSKNLWFQNHLKMLRNETRRLAAYSMLSYWSLVSTARIPLSSMIRCSPLARDLMLTMHKSSCGGESKSFIPKVIINSLEFFL